MSDPETAAPNTTDPTRSIGVTSLPMLRSCPRMVALARFGDRKDRLPATHPFAVLGTIYHDFLERIARGDAGNPPDASGFNVVWEDRITEIERRLHETPDACWLPIRSTMRDLERTRLRAFRAANTLTVTPMRTGSTPPGGSTSFQGAPRLRGPEVPVKIDVGEWSIRGKIDMVLEVGGRLHIIDYKTGAVLDDQGAVKAEYAEQLQLYAGMLDGMNGGRADVLELVDRTGKKNRIPADWRQIDELVSTSVQSVRDFAAKWPRNPRTDADILSAYPTPASDQARGDSGFRHRCDLHRAAMEQTGLVGLGRSEREFESADIHGRVESASSCSLGWAIRLCTPSGKIHLRGAMPREPKAGDLVHAFGVAPGPANPTPAPNEANDFIVPRWGVVQIESDASELPDWPNRPLHAEASTEAESSERDIRPDDICLEVNGGSHVDRIFFVDGTWRSERSLEATSMPPHFLAHVAALLEIQRHVESGAEKGLVVWCRTPQASLWLGEIPPKSLERLTGAEPWQATFQKHREWWAELRASRAVRIDKEKTRPGYTDGPVTTVSIDGKPMVRVAGPNEAFPGSKPRPDASAGGPVNSNVSSHQAEGDSTEAAETQHSEHARFAISTEPDFVVSASADGSRGPGSVTVSACSENGRELGLATTIPSPSSTANALAFLGLLTVARAAVESESSHVHVKCNNNTAITWFAKTSMGKTKTDQHDPGTIEAIRKLLAWLEGQKAAGELSLNVVKASPKDGVRPTATLLRNGQAVLTVIA